MAETPCVHIFPARRSSDLRLTDLKLCDQAPSGEGKWAGTPIDGAEVFLNIGEALDIPKELERIAKELADRKSTRLNSSHGYSSYAVFCLKKKKENTSERKS